MYYVLRPDSALGRTHAYFTTYPEGYDRSAWIAGTAFVTPPPRLSLVVDEGRSTALTDLLLTSFRLLAASPRLVELFQQLNIQNLQYFPVDVLDGNGVQLSKDYVAIQIVGQCGCLDRNHAELSYSADGETLLSVEEFSIIEDHILPLNEDSQKPLIFRLEEFSAIVLAHDSVKTACEKAGISGAKFIKTEDYF